MKLSQNLTPSWIHMFSLFSRKISQMAKSKKNDKTKNRCRAFQKISRTNLIATNFVWKQLIINDIEPKQQIEYN